VPKVVSLLASATEIVCSLGCEPNLIGRSHECDYPPSVHRLPVCTSANVDATRSSLEIDIDVKRHLSTGAPIYNVNRERLAQLHPDVIVTQAHCEVCAVSRKDVETALGKDLLQSAEIVTLMPNRLNDIWNDIERVAKAMKLSDEGRGLIQQCKKRIAAVSQKTAALAKRPRVACIEWIDPLMAAGNWVPELVALAGGENLHGMAGEHSSWMEWLALAESDPDILVILPCGFDLPRVQKEVRTLVSRNEWDTLKAVRNQKVFLVDGNQYFNRPGPRVVESLEILAEIFHPSLFSFGYAPHAWARL
jgi:iron complex transport system substrate-binding protein